MKTKILFLTLFLCISSLGFAQVQFTSEASRETLGVNERVRIDFTMNQDGDNFNPPDFEDFRVVGGPNQSISNTWINGVRNYSKTYSYFLAPKDTGTFTIGQAEITIDGKVYKTLPFTIQVTAAVNNPTDGNNTDLIASENLHLVAEISETSPFLNEAITVVYKLYVSPDISVSNWRQLDSPEYSDFWSQNIDIRQLEVKTGEYKGLPYRYVVLRKTILYPQKTGELDIEPLTLLVDVEVPTNRRTIFGTRLYNTVEKTVAAGNRTINVKPLPQSGKPGSFTGAVGEDLQFEISVNKKSLNATEALEATVRVSGNGNLKLFDLPELQVPASMEVYEPEYTENVQTNLEGMHGSISNTYTIVPQAKGKYPIPALSFSYFDLDSGTYKTLTSEEITINVEQGPNPGAIASGGMPGVNKQPIAAGNQFRYIKRNATLQAIAQKPFFGTPLFWSLFLSPLVLIPLAVLFGRKRKAQANDVAGKRRRRADRLARKYLSKAKKNLGNQKEFYISMERALHNYLKAKLHITTSEMSKEHVSNLLKEKGAKEETTKDFIDILKSCEFARYAPSSNVEMKKDYKKAAEVISALDKQL